MTLNDLENDYINISKLSKSELGKMLSLGHAHKFNTMFGEIISIRAGLDYLAVEGYPERFLSKRKLSVADINSIPKGRSKLVNIKSIMAYLYINKIMSSPKLQKLIMNNDKEFVSYTIKKNHDAISGKGIVLKENDAFKETIEVLTAVCNDFKAGKLSEQDDMIRFIVNMKADKSKTTFDGVVINFETKSI